MLNLHAMGLVYATLLSLVPFLAVAVSVLKAFGAQYRLQPLLTRLLEPLGPQAADVTQRVVDFVSRMNIGVLGALGVAGLFYTVVSLIGKVEGALNDIWNVRRSRGLPRNKGHEAGEAALFDTVEGGLDVGLSYLTVFAFSTENWRRPPSEVRFLMNFNESLLVRRSHELHERDVRIRFIGRRDRVPRRVRRRMEEAEELTAACGRMTLTVALDYGARDELARAVERLAADLRQGRGPRRLGEEAIAERLYAPDLPDVDLFIRTSNEQRISNFLLWQIAYAELWFTEVLWPDFDRQELFRALRDFQRRQRRFGAVDPAASGEEVRPAGAELS